MVVACKCVGNWRCRGGRLLIQGVLALQDELAGAFPGILLPGMHELRHQASV